MYYRVYRNYSAIRSQHPADSNDPSVGRINVDSVPPPHTAVSIMRCISKAEKLDYSKQSQLFTSISSTSPIGEGHFPILTNDRPGSMPEDPMAFVELPAPTYKQLRAEALKSKWRRPTSGNRRDAGMTGRSL